MSDPYGLLTMRDFEEVAKIVEDLRTENARLREAIRRLAEQDATLSVCEGDVTVEMDATLTDAEREALSHLFDAVVIQSQADEASCATLRGLLERTK